MSDEIKQELGFDASQALEALGQLDSGFAKLQTTLNGAPQSFSAFNSAAGKTVSALIQIRDRANEAATALNKLNSIKPPPSVPGGGLPGLPTAGGGNAQGGLLSGQAATNAMNALLGITTNNANQAAGALNNMGSAATAAGNAGQRSTSGFALSLETVTRVIGTQLIVRGLNAIRSAVEDSFQGFIDFNRAIAEIETIAHNESFSQLGLSVRKLSDDFNAPILDVAKAKYQAISNGFVTLDTSTKVVTAALKFAKVGISDTSQAVDLISTSLNAYGKSANEAETISAKLFKTIELGRVVGSELANAFGRVAPIGKEIGATEDELLAAFSSITIGGVKASEAATQIRATLSALLKPSKDATDAFRKLGFESGEQLIQAKGFQGALQALIGTTDGSATAIAKLFPNVRALNGVLRETGTGADIFQEHLKQIKEASSELLNKKFEIRVSSDAEKVAADLNKIKNFFTVDLGSQLVGAAAGFSSVVGGAENLIGIMKALGPVIFAATAALVAYGVTAGTITGINRLLTTSYAEAGLATRAFAGSLAGAVALVAAISIGQGIGNAITANIEAGRKAAEDASNQLLTFQRGQAEAQANVDKIAADEKFQLLHDVIAHQRKAYFDGVDAAQEANKKLIENDKATFEKIISAREKFATDIRRAETQANTDVIDSRKRSNDIQAQLDDQRFNFAARRLNELTKAFKERQRAEDLAKKGSNQLESAKTPEEKEAAQSSFQRAESFARQAISAAQTTGNLAAQVQAERTLEGILQKRIAAEAVFQKARQADAEKLAKAAADEEARVTKLKSLAKDFLKNSDLFDKKGDLLPEEQVNKNLARAKADLAKFKEEAFGPGSKFTLDNLFSFDKLEQRLSQSFTKGEVKQLFASDSALNKLRDQVQGSFDKAPFKLAAELDLDASKLKGLSKREQFNELDAQATNQQDKVEALRQANVARVTAEQTIQAEIKRSNDIFKEQKGIIEAIANDVQRSYSFDRSKVDQQRQALQLLRQETQKLLTDATATPEKVNALGEKFRDLQKSSTAAVGTDLGRAKDEFNALVKIIEKRLELKQLDSQGQNAQNLGRETEILNGAAGRAAAAKAAADAEEKARQATQGAAASAGTFKAAQNDASFASDKIASNMERAASAAERAAAASSQIGGSAAQTAALGGQMSHYASGGQVSRMQFFNSGGAAKGTDNIPALLSQDEFVVNARQSRKFFSQLQSINAGHAPSNNASRAGDTFHIGDININESSNPKATAREVLNLIRREQRRGTGNSLR